MAKAEKAALPAALVASWATCATSLQPSPDRLPAPPYAEREGAPIHLSSDRVSSDEERRTVFVGGVDVERADQRITADRVTYLPKENALAAEGSVEYTDPTLDVKSARAYFDLDTDEGTLEQVDYRLYQRHASGAAEQVTIEGKDTSSYREVSYTTCDPGDVDWELRAKKLNLNTATGVGTARHANLRFMGVPFLYSPYLTFPIDDRRKSGFLVPSIGSSDKTGFDLTVPYYWNIAPNQDATIAPRVMSKRGLMLGSEYRYLLPLFNEGRLQGEYVPYDREFGSARGAAYYTHRGLLAPRLSSFVTAKYASDSSYFEDFGGNLADSSARLLERRADLVYHGGFWNLLSRVQYYQTIDRTIPAQNRPYQRLPQFLFDLELPDRRGGLTYGLQSELVRFDRNDSVNGGRYDLLPSLSLPLRTAAAFVEPSVSLRQTGYALNDVAADNPSHPNRTIPTFSVDSGLFFDRPTGWGDGKVVQTLEPRMYYLYVPYKNQSDLPNFDSADLDFSYWQLFRDNRFSGTDRIGDANQVSWAVSSRLLHMGEGRELLWASLGEIVYFRDRDVTIPGEPRDTSSTSGLVGDLRTGVGSIKMAAGTQVNVQGGQADRTYALLQYRPDPRRVLNLSWRYRRQEYKQSDIAFAWPIGARWELVGRWLYSFRDQESIDSFAGFEYESCCWIVRAIARDYVNGIGGARNRAYMLQLELKGLSSFGEKVAQLLESGILGYEPRRASP